jgi:NADH dehydrogenase FAD-containing subunit
MTVATHPTPNPAHGTRQIVLLGAGHAHLHVLSRLAAQPLPGTVVTLVTPHSHQMLASMVPGFMMGRYAPENFTIGLQPLVQRGGIRWITQSVTALDAANQTLQLDDNSCLHFDWLSINTLPTQDRTQVEQRIPGAREHALFVRPLEAFAALWPRVTEMGDARPLRVAVIGAGTGGVELAFAMRQRLPQAAVTLLCGHAPAAAHCTPRMQERVASLLKQRHITVLQDTAVAMKSGFVQLGCGADLACDVPLLATGTLPAAWLAGSGLALDAQGFIAVDKSLRSSSHDRVFATGDITARIDHLPAHGGTHDRLAGPALAHNLAAAVAGAAPKDHHPPSTLLNLMACGDRYAVGSWGRYSFQGRWVWWFKNRMDRQFLADYLPPA